MDGTILSKKYFNRGVARILSLLEMTNNLKLKEEVKSEIWDIHTKTERELNSNGAKNGLDKTTSNSL